jgi:hypothetical protein
MKAWMPCSLGRFARLNCSLYRASQGCGHEKINEGKQGE